MSHETFQLPSTSRRLLNVGVSPQHRVQGWAAEVRDHLSPAATLVKPLVAPCQSGWVRNDSPPNCLGSFKSRVPSPTVPGRELL